jgi:hypothetical protein
MTSLALGHSCLRPHRLVCLCSRRLQCCYKALCLSSNERIHLPMASPQPFIVAIPDSALEHLQARLALTRLPPELSGAGRARGPPRAEMERLVARWRGGWDWRLRERAINTLPMFTLPLPVAGFGELRLHFVHARAAAPGAIPLLYLHGCMRLFVLTRAGADGGKGRGTSSKSSICSRSWTTRAESTPASTSSRRRSPVLASPMHLKRLASGWSSSRRCVRGGMSSCGADHAAVDLEGRQRTTPGNCRRGVAQRHMWWSDGRKHGSRYVEPPFDFSH